MTTKELQDWIDAGGEKGYKAPTETAEWIKFRRLINNIAQRYIDRQNYNEDEACDRLLKMQIL